MEPIGYVARNRYGKLYSRHGVAVENNKARDDGTVVKYDYVTKHWVDDPSSATKFATEAEAGVWGEPVAVYVVLGTEPIVVEGVL